MLAAISNHDLVTVLVILGIIALVLFILGYFRR